MISIRRIKPEDNKKIAQIIKSVLTEYKADPQTTMLGDPATNHMYENYQSPNAVYYVVELNNQIVGGCGIHQLKGEKDNICELQRMYILPKARGRGIGNKLMQICLSEAKTLHYQKIYIESLSQMNEARSLYEKYQFQPLDSPLGNTCHSGCDVWMVRDI